MTTSPTSSIASDYAADPLANHLRSDRDDSVVSVSIPSTTSLSSEAVRRIVHDLNNALTTVAGYAQLIEGHADFPPQLLRPLQAIARDAARAQILAAQLMVLDESESPSANQPQSTFNSATNGSAAENSAAPVAAEIAFKPSPRSLQILVVDDEEPVITLISEILALDKHRVTPAFNGAEALALLSLEEFDLIISDVRMPAVGGPPFAEILRTQRTDLLPRVIFVTGDTVSPSTRQFLQSASRPVLVKPFSPDRLRALVSQHSLALAAAASL